MYSPKYCEHIILFAILSRCWTIQQHSHIYVKECKRNSDERSCLPKPYQDKFRFYFETATCIKRYSDIIYAQTLHKLWQWHEIKENWLLPGNSESNTFICRYYVLNKSCTLRPTYLQYASVHYKVRCFQADVTRDRQCLPSSKFI